MFNPNTTQFWNKEIRKNKTRISRSPVFIHKNDIVMQGLSTISGRILNIGIGYGLIEERLQNNKNIQLHAIDISDEAIKYAKKRFKGNFKVASSVNIPFKNSYFSCVLVLDVLEHLNDDQLSRTMSEIDRVIVRGGKLIVSVPLNELPKDSRLNNHLRKYNLEQLELELENAGFHIYSVRFLTAFKKLYRVKYLINLILKIKKPNLLIVNAIKK